jgi:single-stranded DNA-binding protein
MLAVLASGTLTREPQRRTASNGRDFATASMRVAVEGADAAIASLIAFGEPEVAALLALKQGDSIAIAGRAALRTWEKDGEKRTGLNVTVDRVMTAYEAGKQKRAAREESYE